MAHSPVPQANLTLLYRAVLFNRAFDAKAAVALTAQRVRNAMALRRWP